MTRNTLSSAPQYEADVLKFTKRLLTFLEIGDETFKFAFPLAIDDGGTVYTEEFSQVLQQINEELKKSEKPLRSLDLFAAYPVYFSNFYLNVLDVTHQLGSSMATALRSILAVAGFEKDLALRSV